MTLYRFYPTDPDGYVLARWERECAADDEAVAFAKTLTQGTLAETRIEVWDHGRRVAVISKEKPGEPPA